LSRISSSRVYCRRRIFDRGSHTGLSEDEVFAKQFIRLVYKKGRHVLIFLNYTSFTRKEVHGQGEYNLRGRKTISLLSLL
jgi:hypothetical protein